MIYEDLHSESFGNNYSNKVAFYFFGWIFNVVENRHLNSLPQFSDRARTISHPEPISIFRMPSRFSLRQAQFFLYSSKLLLGIVFRLHRKSLFL